MSDRFCYGTGPSRQKRVNARIRGSAAEHGSWVWRCNAITSAACVLAAGGGEERLADEWHAKRARWARWASWASWARWASVEEWGYTCVVVLRETRETSSSARAYVYGVYVFVTVDRTKPDGRREEDDGRTWNTKHKAQSTKQIAKSGAASL
ncbi:uncharacterized protein UMAG_05342 [Mycosarcoma maydis]|uniref:Uncharacterized protein n=1 Tax=Mycosarcoma maydis TaxID=5270 RepID=A0A0D1DQU5_MYCMD|nr:uncharacterized protein UMAG_05342 [Ustilago maydis 521]KIS66341.1 hypothetical protein UMAG_05342 [Ustilago maydis 521]|eukprot:XP_011392045.1 hypothetical protein UMAG_05342 [Ustilago maydis 521]